MLKVYGTVACPRCKVIKSNLDGMDLTYEYYDLDKIPQEERAEIVNRAKAKNLGNLPIIEQDGEIIPFQEVL